jgi:hypothetical protein
MAILSEMHTREAAPRWQEVGVPRWHDVREEPAGTFAGTIGPDAPVGTFGNVRVRRGRGAGTYAGNPDHQRQGSFADVEPPA